MSQGGSLTMPQVGSFKSVSVIVTGNAGVGGRRRRRSKKKESRRGSTSPALSSGESSRSVLQSAENGVLRNERRMPKAKRSSFFTKESKQSKQTGNKQTDEFRHRCKRKGKGIDLGEVETDESSGVLEEDAPQGDPLEPTVSERLRSLATCNGSDSRRELADFPPHEIRDGNLNETAYQNAASCQSVTPLRDARQGSKKFDAIVAAQSCTNLVSPNAMKLGALAGTAAKSFSTSALSSSKAIAEITAEVGDMIVDDLATQTDYLVEELLNFFDPPDEAGDDSRSLPDDRSL